MTRRPLRRGMISLATAFVLLALLMLLAVVWNATRVTHRKLEGQNAADAAANAAGLQYARGMNQLVAVQHMIGEMTAVVVLIDSIGGPELTEAGGEVRGALGKARERLAGVRAAGFGATELAAEESARLDRIEQTARTEFVPLRRRIRQVVLPALADHARRIVERTPELAEAAAAEAAAAHGFDGRLFPDTSGRGPRLEFPVVAQTPELVAAAGGWESSQAVRAATPWVQYWRKPALTFGDRELPLSGYADFYFEVTNRLTLAVPQELAERDRIHLFVLKDAGGAKGREPWATRGGSQRADELFSLLAFAHGASGQLGSVFRDPQPDGIAAMAQVMLYNANPQDPDRPPPASLRPADWQPVVGWDTLNWTPDVRVPEYRFGLRRDDEGRVVQPQLLTNWRSRLTPVTRLAEAAKSAGDDELGRILRRTDAGGWPANTH